MSSNIFTYYTFKVIPWEWGKNWKIIRAMHSIWKEMIMLYVLPIPGRPCELLSPSCGPGGWVRVLPWWSVTVLPVSSVTKRGGVGVGHSSDAFFSCRNKTVIFNRNTFRLHYCKHNYLVANKCCDFLRTDAPICEYSATLNCHHKFHKPSWWCFKKRCSSEAPQQCHRYWHAI